MSKHIKSRKYKHVVLIGDRVYTIIESPDKPDGSQIHAKMIMDNRVKDSIDLFKRTYVPAPSREAMLAGGYNFLYEKSILTYTVRVYALPEPEKVTPML